VYGLIACDHPSTADAFMTDTTRQPERDDMVSQQLIARGIQDTAVLQAMRQVPRHQFVPVAHVSEAYEDHPLSIGHGQTISQPYIVAFMTEALKLQTHDTVLEVGTGSGYQAAVLAKVVHRVFTIEIVEPLALQAARKLEELGYDHVTVRTGDGYQGWPEEAPFDAVILTAAPSHVPQPLLDQLSIGGRLILPVGTDSQKLVLFRRTEAGFRRTELLPVAFVPMTGEVEKGFIPLSE